jgi:hypothetical protein
MRCDSCKEEFDTLSEEKLCFACNTFHTFASIIEDSTELGEEGSMELAEDLQEAIFLMILERAKGGQSLEEELLRCMKVAEASN